MKKILNKTDKQIPNVSKAEASDMPNNAQIPDVSGIDTVRAAACARIAEFNALPYRERVKKTILPAVITTSVAIIFGLLSFYVSEYFVLIAVPFGVISFIKVVEFIAILLGAKRAYVYLTSGG